MADSQVDGYLVCVFFLSCCDLFCFVSLFVEPPKDWRQDLAEMATAEMFGNFGIFGFFKIFVFLVFFEILKVLECLDFLEKIEFYRFSQKKRRSYLQGSCLQSSGGSS